MEKETTTGWPSESGYYWVKEYIEEDGEFSDWEIWRFDLDFHGLGYAQRCDECPPKSCHLFSEKSIRTVSPLRGPA
jgi:hypothetical protein